MYIDKLKLEIEICGFCPLMCKDICCFHGNAKTEDSAPHFRNLVLWRVIEAKKEEERKRLLKEAADVIYQCTLCGQCTAWCAKSRDIPTNMMAGRADVIENGFAPPGAIEIDKKTALEHNPYGEPHTKRLHKLEPIFKKACLKTKGSNIGIWFGCTISYYQPEMANALVNIFNFANIDFTILGEDEWCCGLPLYKLGFRYRASELAEHNIKKLKDKGIETLIVDCPECYRAFKDFYPSMGYNHDLEVVYSSEFLLDLINDGRITPKKKISNVVTYHDPCELARHSTPEVRNRYKTSDIFDSPRKILSLLPGMTLREMRWEKGKTFCCGGEVVFSKLYPEVSQSIGKKVPLEALKIGANILAVGCPECKRQFNNIINNKGNILEVYSIVELLAKSL